MAHDGELAARDELRKRIKRIHPDAEACHEWGLDGWRIPRRVEGEQVGTLNPNFAYILPAQRKAGITLHVWNPADYEFLEGQPYLAEVGFKVMKGCMQWNRKADLPMDVIERLLVALRDSLDAEAS